MGKYFAKLIEEETYNFWQESQGAIPMTALVSGSGDSKYIIPVETKRMERVNQFTVFGRVGDLPGTEYCVIRPHLISLEDWEPENTFLVRSI